MARLPRYMKMTNQRIEGSNWVFDMKVAKWGIPALVWHGLKQYDISWLHRLVLLIRIMGLYYYRKVKSNGTKH